MVLIKHSLIFSITLIFSSHCSTELAQGLRYEKILRKNPPQVLHILQVNPRFMAIELGIAGNKCTQALKTHNIALQHNALAAINGGFFDYGTLSPFRNLAIKFFDTLGFSRYQAFPLWTVKSNNQYFSVSPVTTGAIAWNKNEQRPIFTELKSKIQLTINTSQYEVPVFNKPTREGPGLYSSTYDAVTPYFPRPVIEICIQESRVIAIHRSSHGKRVIPSDGYIYVVPIRQHKKISKITLKDKVLVTNTLTQNSHSPVTGDFYDTILASTPLLIRQGQIIESLKHRTSEFATKPQPRTAVGLLADGSWFFIVVDGRQKNAQGLTLLELAHLMKKFGCTEALNLDGGGSSTMVLKGKVVNSPSGSPYSLSKKERPLSNAIIIRPKKGGAYA